MKRMLGTIALLAGLFALVVTAGMEHPASAATPAFYRIDRDIINDTITVLSSLTADQQHTPAFAKFTVDSSLLYRTGAYSRMALCIRVIPTGGDTLNPVTLGVQIRGHLSDSTLAGSYADTAGTFVWPGGWTQLPTTASADSMSEIDPIGTGGGTTAVNLLLKGEMHVRIMPWLGRGSADGGVTRGTNSGPAGLIVPLCDSRGVWFAAPFTDIRVRAILGPAAALGKPRVVVHLIEWNI